MLDLALSRGDQHDDEFRAVHIVEEAGVEASQRGSTLPCRAIGPKGCSVSAR